MYRQPSKRKVILQRTVVYGLMSIAVALLVTILILVMLGYQLNQAGRIEQGGLVQFESRPTGANVSIDNMTFGSQTNTKATLAAGGHFIKMERNGYRPWQKSVNVIPGSVLWLNYARLIPTELKQTHVAEFSTVSSSASSDDNKWMVIKEDPGTPLLRLADLTQDKVKISDLQIPVESFTPPASGKTQSFIIEKWDQDNRYVLVKHVRDDTKVEWLVVDTRDVANTKNVTAQLGITAKKIEFSRDNSQILFALTDTNDVRRIDLGQATMSGPLLTGVADFSLFEKTIAYTGLINPDTKARGVGYLEEGAKQPRVVRSYTDDGTLPLHIRIGKYFDDTYVAIGYGGTVDILTGKLPRDEEASLLKTESTMTLKGGVDYLSVKTNGRFVVAQSGSAFNVYDLELKKMSTTETPGTSAATKEFDWIDSYMPWSDRDGTLRFYEFDGANQQAIMPVIPGQSVTLSQNGKYVYGLSKQDDGKVHLSRVQLLLN